MSDGHTIHIVPWSQTHVPWLTYAIGEFFEAGLAQGGDILVTPRNIDAYLSLGLRGAEDGDPCLLAIVNDTPVSYIMWVGVPAVLDSKWKTLNAAGSYTEPAWRHQGISFGLRETGVEIAKQRGYERLTATAFVSNERGLQDFCVDQGAWPISTTVEMRFE